VSRISFALWTHLVMGLVHEQACYCKGSFQQLAHAFVTGLQNYGGQIAYKRMVESIEVGNGAVRGVRLRDGHVVEADTVICNADMVGAYTRLLPAEYRPPGMVRKLRGMRETMGGFTVYVETDLDLTTTGLVHETVVLGDLDLEKCFAGLERGNNTAFVLSAPSLTDPGLCPEGKHQIMIATFVPYDANLDRTAKDARKMALLERAYAVVPELRGRVLYAEAGSPRTCERYTANYRGAALGWESSPWQSGYKRPSPISPIKGLFHAGHWTRPGGGVYGTIVSGRNAAQFAMGYKDPAKFFRDLQNMS
jgi:prolycopene isomerase